MNKLLAAAAAAALLLAGCGSNEETEVASGTYTDPETGKTADYKVTTDGADGNQVSFKTEDGDMSFGAFKREYDLIKWAHGTRAKAWFQAWCEGRTGYPLVDAAMRQLNQTGYMHNRLRMVTASFLTKDLGVDWRWGEAYFAEKLLDFDLAANNGGWQWAASTGCDAQPYFRIFNPINQSEKFDPQGKFIRRYLPQLAGLSDKSIHAPWAAPAMERLSAGVELGRDYPHPVVDHALAREKTLERYAVVKKAG